jgi:hypothetical protein
MHDDFRCTLERAILPNHRDYLGSILIHCSYDAAGAVSTVVTDLVNLT